MSQKALLSRIHWKHVYLVFQLCQTLWDRLDCSLPGSSVHRVFQGRILEWVAIYSSRRSSQPRDWTHVSCVFCIAGEFFTCWGIEGAPNWKHLMPQTVSHINQRLCSGMLGGGQISLKKKKNTEYILLLNHFQSLFAAHTILSKFILAVKSLDKLSPSQYYFSLFLKIIPGWFTHCLPKVLIILTSAPLLTLSLLPRISLLSSREEA